jgi:hypothetical protein
MSEKERPKESWIALAIVIPLESLILPDVHYQVSTVISSDGLYYRWGPFQRSYRFVSKEEIAQAELRKGPPLTYGVTDTGYGKVHNVGPGKAFSLH